MNPWVSVLFQRPIVVRLFGEAFSLTSLSVNEPGTKGIGTIKGIEICNL